VEIEKRSPFSAPGDVGVSWRVAGRLSSVAATVPLTPLSYHELWTPNEGNGFPSWKPQSPFEPDKPVGFAVTVRWRLHQGLIRSNRSDGINRPFSSKSSNGTVAATEERLPATNHQALFTFHFSPLTLTSALGFNHRTQPRQETNQVDQVPDESKELENAEHDVDLVFDEQIGKPQNQGGCSSMEGKEQGHNPADVLLLVPVQIAQQLGAWRIGALSHSPDEPSVKYEDRPDNRRKQGEQRVPAGWIGNVGKGYRFDKGGSEIEEVMAEIKWPADNG
jgi:hypothetical protein